MPTPLYDIAIIGASVSGSSLAIRLGKAGLKTALIDKQTFPRRKACGEGVSDIALDSLYELGLKEDIEQLGGKPFFSFRIGLGQHCLSFATSTQPLLKGIGIPRYRLDKLLVDHASRAPTTTTLLGSPVTDIKKTTYHHLISLDDGQQITARYLVLADGTNSVNARKLGIPKTSKTRAPLWGINFVMEGEYQSTTGEVSILLKDGYEVYCTPVSDTTLNVALLARKDKLVQLQDEKLQKQLLVEASEKSCFRGEVIGRPLTVGPVGSNKRPYIYGSTLLLGDTTESLDPIAGMGITHGILMSIHAANALISIFRHKVPEEKAFKNYTQDCKKMSRIYRGFTLLTASLFRSPLREILLPALSSTRLPFLINNALRYKSTASSILYLPFTKFLQLLGS